MSKDVVPHTHTHWSLTESGKFYLDDAWEKDATFVGEWMDIVTGGDKENRFDYFNLLDFIIVVVAQETENLRSAGRSNF